MKKYIKSSVSLFLCAAVLCISAYAQGFVHKLDWVYANVSFPSDYNVVTLEDIDSCTGIIEKTGIKKDDYKKMMEEVFAYAVGYSSDMSTEIWINVYTDESAEAMFNMDNFTEEDMEIYKDSVTADDTYKFEASEFITGDNGRFFKTVRSAEGKYSVTYATIKNGAYYTINLKQKNEGALTDKSLSDAEYVYKNLEFTKKFTDPNDKFAPENILTIICLAALCATSFAIIVVVLKRTGFIKTSNKPKTLKTTKHPRLK